MERARAWAEDKEREKIEIARLDDEANKNTEFEARERKNANIVNSVAVDYASNIRASDNIQGAKRKREDAEARSKTEAQIRKKAEKTRKARDATAKAEAETMEREREWTETK